MNIYEVISLEKQIEEIAKNNEGEIPEDKFKELIEAQTKSITQIEKLCRYIRHLELFSDTCKAEENRINSLRIKSEKRLENIKKYLIPFVAKKGKFDAGTFNLSIRKSSSVEIDKNFKNLDWGDITEKYTADKKLIKKALQNGSEISGAKLIEKENLQIK
jgi:hypothetical protein